MIKKHEKTVGSFSIARLTIYSALIFLIGMPSSYAKMESLTCSHDVSGTTVNKSALHKEDKLATADVVLSLGGTLVFSGADERYSGSITVPSVVFLHNLTGKPYVSSPEWGKKAMLTTKVSYAMSGKSFGSDTGSARTGNGSARNSKTYSIKCHGPKDGPLKNCGTLTIGNHSTVAATYNDSLASFKVSTTTNVEYDSNHFRLEKKGCAFGYPNFTFVLFNSK